MSRKSQNCHFVDHFDLFFPNFGQTTQYYPVNINQYLVKYLALGYVWSSKGYVRHSFAILLFMPKRDYF